MKGPNCAKMAKGDDNTDRNNEWELSNHVAYRLVHSLAMRSCSSRFWRYWVAMLPTRGSAGLQSVRREQIDSRTLEMVNAGDQLSFNISRHITPWLLILQW